MPFPFEHTYARLPEHFFARVTPTPVARPALIAVNTELAEELGPSAAELASPAGVEMLAGNRLPATAEPIAMAYAGHQFGAFVRRLGDGRAILLGELIDRDRRRRDLQLKGAGPTPWSRGGDGRAGLGPVLREFVVSEAMAALGVPTTRALAAVTTGEIVFRDPPAPGAVLARVASSHLRVGTFEYFAARGDRDALAQLTGYALARHYPDADLAGGAALALLEAVLVAQARLVAAWLGVGFVHGVMNTDNTSIAGETIDYGPCAFLDTHVPQRTFSSIDHDGRYAYAQQPRIAAWNLARLGDALLPLIDDDRARAAGLVNERLEAFPVRLEAAHTAEMRRKLGLALEDEDDTDLARGLLTLMAARGGVDHTVCFRRLADTVEDDAPLAALFGDAPALTPWIERWRYRLAQDDGATPAERAARLRRANPAFIPRNHQIEAMIAAAQGGDLGPFERLRHVLARPFDDQPGAADLAAPPGAEQWSYRTFCGT